MITKPIYFRTSFYTCLKYGRLDDTFAHKTYVFREIFSCKKYIQGSLVCTHRNMLSYCMFPALKHVYQHNLNQAKVIYKFSFWFLFHRRMNTLSMEPTFPNDCPLKHVTSNVYVQFIRFVIQPC